MTTKDGTMVNAVYGFITMLFKVIQDLNPTHLAVSFDVSGKTFRDDLYDKYKATRVKADQSLYDQIPLVHEVVRAFGIPIYTKEGFEADDVIGTIVEKIGHGPDKIESVIVTGDMDILQLVDEHTSVYELRKGLSDIVMFDPGKVKERYGFGPEHVVDYKALRGDVSDNIPGIKGIGEKTATELIQKFGSIEEMYEKIRSQESEMKRELKPSVFKKMVEGKNDAEMSKKLATIERDVKDFDFSLEDSLWKGIKKESVMPLFQKFEFFSLLKRLPGNNNEEVGVQKDSEEKSEKKLRKNTVNLTTLSSEVFAEIFPKIAKEKVWIVKELLGGQDIFSSELTGFVIFVDQKSYYIDWRKISAKEKKEVLSAFGSSTRVLVGHDVKQMVKVLILNETKIQGKIFDIMIASYVINSSTRAHDLKSIVLRELGKELPAASDQTSLFGADPKNIALELLDISEVFARFTKALSDREDVGLFEKVEMELIPVLAQMELNGIAVDTELLAKLKKESAHDIDLIVKKIWKEAGVEFNVASSVQLREVLFDKMQLPLEGIKKGKTGLSTAASELEKLRGLHPIIAMIEEHRELAKLQNTYIDVLPTLINKKTRRIHTTFNQAVAATGRLSSTDPNLQNIPIRTPMGKKIRDAFISMPGNVLITADYSQIELRIVASLAKDERMIEVFKKGEDIHAATAAAINGVPLAQVTKEMRYAAKEVNFGVLYGMGAYGLSSRTGISQSEAQDFIKKYFSEFAGVKKYVDQTLAFAKKEGYVETLFGRRRYIPELKASNFQVRSSGERMAVNMPIQGTAADLMKLAMIAVANKIENGNWKKEDVRMILQVHDELILEVKKGLEDEVSALVKKAMEEVVELRVPVEVHVAVGTRWGEMK
jgi:DNA polymerase-1